MGGTVLLDHVDHGGLRIAVRHGTAFGDAVNQMLVVPTEFIAAQRDYPILFRFAPDTQFTAVVLLGLDRDENLFLDRDGWAEGRYVPAVQRRGPFAIDVAADDSEDWAIRVALTDLRVDDAEGRPLFLPHGSKAPYLTHVREALSTLHAGAELAAAMYRAFDDAGLLTPVRIDVTVDDGRRYVIDDCWAIDGERLATLDGATLGRLNQAGYLALAFAAHASLDNVQRLIALKNRVIAAGPGPAHHDFLATYRADVGVPTNAS
ncbi:MAG: SapC family protein [Sphingomonas phyllosphaerae]|uniref:SapC family protein n=1 Tax=Sphingomonas phyllosphaerae TaxID=257003 RepID=UPI002FF68887